MYRLFCGAALSVALYAAADVVNTNDVSVFQPGTTIASTAVNSTIAALIDAIDDNAARIAALESHSSTLVAGRLYALRQIGVLFGGNNAGGVTVANLSQSYTVDVDDANGYSFVGSENEGEVTLNGLVIAQSLDEPVSFSGSYVQNGSTLTLTIENARWRLSSQRTAACCSSAGSISPLKTIRPTPGRRAPLSWASKSPTELPPTPTEKPSRTPA